MPQQLVFLILGLVLPRQLELVTHGFVWPHQLVLAISQHGAMSRVTLGNVGRSLSAENNSASCWPRRPSWPKHSRQSRASHDGDWPLLRGSDGHPSSTWYCGEMLRKHHPTPSVPSDRKISSGFVSAFCRASKLPRRRFCVWRSLCTSRLSLGRETRAHWCWPGKPTRVRTLRTKLGLVDMIPPIIHLVFWRDGWQIIQRSSSSGRNMV